MGSIVYIGLILGSMIAGPIFMKYKSKIILLISVTIFLILMSSFIFFKNFYILAVARTLSGFF
jgi:hypothetical protein